MSFNLTQILSHMGPLGMAIAGFLILMGIACIGVVIERLVALRKSEQVSRAFAGQASKVLGEWNLDEFVALAKKHKPAALPRVLGAMAQKYQSAAAHAHEGDESPLDFARNEAERVKEATGADLRRGMNVLATTGSVAPFVGLLGTVVGIIAAFQGIAASGSGGIAAISAGISEALIETALGLMIAIPAVLFFNILTARINAMEMQLARSAGEFMDELEANHSRRSATKIPAAAAA
ncbi:MAG: MotA/TolQ/ExbB proton channel family protein [Deltaproteobacteria bacterium]|nr:MotA/TolQ/ExbB proton channel family protein [Deltaproteobacteria bacterium]